MPNIKLKYGARCARCLQWISAGTEASWDPKWVTHAVACVRFSTARRRSERPRSTAEVERRFIT